MAALPDSTTLIYNGIQFSSHTSSSLSGKVTYDDSNRSVKYMRWTLSVHSWFSGDDLDMTMEELHIRLTKPAKRLIIKDKGMGDFDINGPGPVRDAAWGPHPEMISMAPLGGGRGVIFDWQISFSVPHCTQARYDDVVAVVYTIDWSIDDDGYTERRINGSVEIAMTRKAGSNKVPDSADRFRAMVIPTLPERFTRTQSYQLSSDRRTLTFSFVDKELPEALPGGVSKIEVEQSLSAGINQNGGFFVWDVAFSCSATPVAGLSNKFAYNAIMDTIGRRLLYIRDKKPLKPAPKNNNPIANAINKEIEKALFGLGTPRLETMPTSFRVSEQLYGRSVRVEATFSLLGSSLFGIIADSGLFVPLNNDAKAWREDTFNQFIDGRGHAKMQHVPGEEALIDLCVAPEFTTNVTKLSPKPEIQQFQVPRPEGGGGPRKINANASWLSYKNNLRILEQNRVAIHKRIPVDDPAKLDPKPKGPDAGKADAKNLKKEVKADFPGGRVPPEAGEVVQKLGAPGNLLEMTGSAIRLGLKAPAPKLLKIGGKDVVQMSADIKTTTAGKAGDVDLKLTTWKILYAVQGQPVGEIPNLANPLYGSDGGAA